MSLPKVGYAVSYFWWSSSSGAASFTTSTGFNRISTEGVLQEHNLRKSLLNSKMKEEKGKIRVWGRQNLSKPPL